MDAADTGKFSQLPECNPAKRSVSYIATQEQKRKVGAAVYLFIIPHLVGFGRFVILSNFIHVLTSSTVTVGFAEGIQGPSQCIFALVAGIAADRFSREFSFEARRYFWLSSQE